MKKGCINKMCCHQGLLCCSFLGTCAATHPKPCIRHCQCLPRALGNSGHIKCLRPCPDRASKIVHIVLKVNAFALASCSWDSPATKCSKFMTKTNTKKLVLEAAVRFNMSCCSKNGGHNKRYVQSRLKVDCHDSSGLGLLTWYFTVLPAQYDLMSIK